VLASGLLLGFVEEHQKRERRLPDSTTFERAATAVSASAIPPTVTGPVGGKRNRRARPRMTAQRCRGTQSTGCSVTRRASARTPRKSRSRARITPRQTTRTAQLGPFVCRRRKVGRPLPQPMPHSQSSAPSDRRSCVSAPRDTLQDSRMRGFCVRANTSHGAPRRAGPRGGPSADRSSPRAPLARRRLG
jgi:hypothetical protein